MIRRRNAAATGQTLALLVGLVAGGCQQDVPVPTVGAPVRQPVASPGGTASNTPLPAARPATESPETEAPADAEAPRWKLAPLPQDKKQLVPITFDDLTIDMPQDSVFKPELLTDRVKQLEGRRVRIRGFIFPSIFQQTGITSFPLVKNTQCKFGPGGIAHHIVMVELKPGLSTSFTVRPVGVEGVLSIRPYSGPDGNTWAIYHVTGDAIE